MSSVFENKKVADSREIKKVKHFSKLDEMSARGETATEPYKDVRRLAEGPHKLTDRQFWKKLYGSTKNNAQNCR